MTISDSGDASREASVTAGTLRATLRRFARHRLAMAGAGIIIILVIVAVFAPHIAPWGYRQYNYQMLLQPPSVEYLLGTDSTGACVLSRIIYASRISLTVGFLAMGVAMILGSAVGALAGFYGGILDNFLMRLVVIALCILPLFLLLMLVAIVPPTTVVMVVAIGITAWMRPARIVRGEFLQLREQDFVEAARAVGAPSRVIIIRHVLPNAMGPLLVNATLMVGQAIITESILSFLGVGIQPPVPSWGNMLSDAQNYLWLAPWMAVFPGLMILVTVLAFNLLGDGLRDALDPRLRK
ncbi:MAG: ABC transporter permease [Bacillota bacterium]